MSYTESLAKQCVLHVNKPVMQTRFQAFCFPMKNADNEPSIDFLHCFILLKVSGALTYLCFISDQDNFSFKCRSIYLFLFIYLFIALF